MTEATEPEATTTQTTIAAVCWEARPLAALPGSGGRWGIEHRPTGRWVAYGSEARCRALAVHLAEADAILTRLGPPPGPAGPPGPAESGATGG